MSTVNTETVQYKGRVITLHITKRGRQFSWAYQIDDESIKECNDRPLPSASLAREEALDDAKWAVERMKRK